MSGQQYLPVTFSTLANAGATPAPANGPQTQQHSLNKSVHDYIVVPLNDAPSHQKLIGIQPPADTAAGGDYVVVPTQQLRAAAAAANNGTVPSFGNNAHDQYTVVQFNGMVPPPADAQLTPSLQQQQYTVVQFPTNITAAPATRPSTSATVVPPPQAAAAQQHQQYGQVTFSSLPSTTVTAVPAQPKPVPLGGATTVAAGAPKPVLARQASMPSVTEEPMYVAVMERKGTPTIATVGGAVNASPNKLSQSARPVVKQPETEDPLYITRIERSGVPAQTNDVTLAQFDSRWYLGPITRESAEQLLSRTNQRTFLVRESSQPGALSLSKFDPSFVQVADRFGHLLIVRSPSWHLKGTNKDPNFYDSIDELIQRTPVLAGFSAVGSVLHK